MHFLSVLTDRVHWLQYGFTPLPDVHNSCIPLCYFSAPYCRHHVRFCEKVFEKFVNFERIFCMYPERDKLTSHMNFLPTTQ